MDSRSKDELGAGRTQDQTSGQEVVAIRTAVQRIGAFAAVARPEHLTSEIRQLYKRNILDSLGCGIAALPGPPFQALREQLDEYRVGGRCTLIGAGKTSGDHVALFQAVAQIDAGPASDLMNLLSKVQPSAVFSENSPRHLVKESLWQAKKQKPSRDHSRGPILIATSQDRPPLDRPAGKH